MAEIKKKMYAMIVIKKLIFAISHQLPKCFLLQEEEEGQVTIAVILIN